ncbi:MAG: hypothetical protein NTV39_01785 [Candidatus Saccharibacteria bacterium]|nr:hypothetical protein [Candidatus Saccharibacteria bacterium]
MPEEPQNNEQQPEPTPHFDAFSGNSATDVEPTTGPAQSSAFNSNPAPTPTPAPTPSPVSETPITPTPVQDGPVTTFAPNPSVNHEFARIPDGITTQSIAPETSSGKPKWFKQKKFVTGIVVVFLLALVGGGSAFAYTSYQNPQKVISDSIINAVTAKTSIYTGTLSVVNSDMKLNVNITSKMAAPTGSLDAKVTVTAQNKTYSVSGSGLIDESGDVYFKVSGLAGVVNEAKSSLGITQSSPVSASIDKLVAKIDGVWVKVSSKDLKQYSESTATTKTCLNDTINKYKDDKAAISEVTDLYKKNPFLVISKELGQVNGSYGYEIKGDNKASISFIKGFKDTKIYKSLHNCDSSFTIYDNYKNADTFTDSNKNNTFKLWASVWSHQITKIEAGSSSDGTKTALTILPKFNQTVTITAPKSSISLSQLQSYIEELTQTAYGGSYSGLAPTSSSAVTEHAKTSQSQTNANSALVVAETFNADNNFYPGTTTAFYSGENYKQLTGVHILPNVSSITSANGQDNVAWSCLNVCAYTKGGRIAYYDYTTNAVAYMYAGAATVNDKFVNSQ